MLAMNDSSRSSDRPDVDVWHEFGDRFVIDIRGHELWVDQPVGDGGGDLGPTPTELFVASLASCAGFYAGRFLRRHGLSPDGLRVACRFDMAEDRPARVRSITLAVSVGAALSPSQREALQRVVEHCTVHNSIRLSPEIGIEVEGAAVAA